MRKKKILFQCDFAMVKTGFGRFSKSLLEYLYKTGKYDLVHYCVGAVDGAPELERTPWRSIGCLPNNRAEIDALNKDPHIARQASYGAHFLDKVIYEEKPDVYIASQDIWGVEFAINKNWFNKITSVIWTTLDSLPLLPTAISAGKKVKNYWIWSDFATKELHRLGHKHAKTVHGCIDTSPFFRMDLKARQTLREQNGIPKDAFITGFVFRNQLRKSVPNLLEGFAKFCEMEPRPQNPRLLLHTNFKEGWDIPRLISEYKINPKHIYTTYICKSCHKYSVTDYTGPEQDCPHCKSKKSMHTTSPGFGVTEEQLNEVYNLMDVYCHAFTSGGQEIPIQEAKLTELITLVTNYSCGEEMCQPDANSLALDWAPYREPGSQFIKATTKSESIAKNLHKVLMMPKAEADAMGKKAREWALNNFSVEVVGKQIEEFLDNSPITDFDFNNEEAQPDPQKEIPEIENDSEWIKYLYANILARPHVDEDDEGHVYWMGEIKKGMARAQIEQFFRQTAVKQIRENQSKKAKFEDLLDKDDDGKRLLIAMPKSAGDVFWLTSLLPDIKRMYPDFNIYFATEPQFKDVLNGNEYVHKWIPYSPIMDNLLFLEGQGAHKGFFEIAFLPYVGTQKILNYLHNGKDKLSYNIKS